MIRSRRTLYLVRHMAAAGLAAGLMMPGALHAADVPNKPPVSRVNKQQKKKPAAKTAETQAPDHNRAEVGVASWYGGRAAGQKLGNRRTASGEALSDHAMTAAHRTLPIGSTVRVTVLDTGRTVDVVINDRGPGAKTRVIDVSVAAAKELGIVGRGVARVSVTPLTDLPNTPGRPNLFSTQVAEADPAVRPPQAFPSLDVPYRGPIEPPAHDARDR